MFRYDGHNYPAVVEKAPEAGLRYRVWFPDLPGCETRTESNDLHVVITAAHEIFSKWFAFERELEEFAKEPGNMPFPGYPSLFPWCDLLAHSGRYKVLLGHGVIYLASGLPAALRGDHPAG